MKQILAGLELSELLDQAWRVDTDLDDKSKVILRPWTKRYDSTRL